MTVSDYTPTTEQVEFAYANDSEDEYRDPIGYPALVRQNKVEFRRWLAAHDAEKRAEWEAEQGETEWEYIAQFGHVKGEERITAEAAIQSAREVLDDYPLDFPESELPLQVLRRPLVGWLPVPYITNNESEGKA